jgi:hypothetical protein
MSLQHAANHLAAHGRGPDTELVHMTKGEINSLQTLAKANGGSLTINPHTGLAEAGFLSSILPMAVGAAAMYFSGGTATPLLGGLGMGLSSAGTIGALTGAAQYARTGSLNKGLMAGLGAYGGAGLAGGAMNAIATNEANALTQTGADLAGKETAALGDAAAKSAVESAGPKMIGADLEQMSAAQAAKANMLSPDVIAQSAREYATNTAGTAANPFSAGTQAALDSASTAQANLANLAPKLTNPQMMKMGLAAAVPALMQREDAPPVRSDDGVMPQRLQYNSGIATPTPAPDVPGYDDLGRDFGRQRSYFPNAGYQNITPEQAKQLRGYAGGGPVEAMSNANAIGANTGYPQADINKAVYSTPYQTPVSQNVVQGTADAGVNSMTGEMNEFAKGGLSSAASHLGDYSDGGRLLKGPGDGVSDSIPATIGNKRPARLADGEFVVPARIVSELGNGSTEAGARKLYAMLDRVQAARKKSIGKGKVAKNSRADKLLPA